MADNITRDDLKDVVATAFRQGQQSAAAKQQAGGGDILKGLTEGAKVGGSALAALAEGGNNFGSVLGATGSQLKGFGKLGELAGGALSYVGKYAQESVDAMRNFGKFGASFGGDAMDMRVQIAGTRMSLEEYGKTLSKNKDLLTSMGGSVDRGAVQFNRFSKEFFDSDASERLRMLGMTSEEINGALAIELASRRFSNMEDAKSREAARASAEAMATEMDKIAKQTGKSREAQQEELSALQRDGKFQAAIRLQMMNGNKFAAEGIQSAMAQMNKFGAPVQNLMKDLVSYGTAQKDTAGIMAALGPAGTQLQTAMAAVKGAKTEEQKAAAQAQLRAAERAVEEQLMSRQFNENAALGIKGFQDVANSTTNLTAGLDKIAATEGLDLNKAADRAKAIAIRDRQIAESQATQQNKPGTQAAPGKATSDAVIKFEQTLGNTTAAVQKQVVDRLNNEIAPGMKKFSDFLGSPTGRFSRENQEEKIKSGIDDITKVFKEPRATVGGAVENAGRQGRETAEAGRRAREEAAAQGLSPEAQRAAEQAARQQSRQRPDLGAVTNPLGGLFTTSQPGVVTIAPGTANPQGPMSTPTRDTGTLGMTGALFEKQDFFGKVAKGETVMTPEQLTNLVRGVRGSGLESAVSAMAGSFKGSDKQADVGQQSISTLENAVKGIKIPSLDLSKIPMPKIDIPKIDIPKIDIKTTEQKSIGTTKPAGFDEQLLQQLAMFGMVVSNVESSMSNMNKELDTVSLPDFSQLFDIDLQSMMADKIEPPDFSQLFDIDLQSMMADKVQGIEFPELPAFEGFDNFAFDFTEFETPLTTIEDLYNQAIAESDKLLEQTQSLAINQKTFAESEIENISMQLSNLDEQKDYQQMRAMNLSAEVEILQNKKTALDQLSRRDQADIEHSERQIALYREMIDQAQTADEVTDLQNKLALEEQDLSDAKFDLAMRQQSILDTNADISLKEQQLYDAREELADTEAAIQDKKEELFSATIDALDREERTALESTRGYGQQDAAGGYATGIDMMAEDGTVSQGMKINPETGETYYTEETAQPESAQAKPIEPKSGKDAYSSVLDKFFGPMAGPKSTVAGAEAGKTAATQAADAAKVEEERRRNEATPAQRAGQADGKPVTAGTKEATLNDVVKSLDTLNKQVGLLNSEMSKLPNLMEKTVKATKALNGNVNASV